MKRFIYLSLALASLTTATHAATEFEGDLVPADFARALTGGGEFFSSLPDNFPLANLELDVPLQLLGTHAQSPFFSRVYLQSTASTDELAYALAPALDDAGWLLMSSHASTAQRVAAFCHDEHGSLNLIAEPAGAGSVLTVQLNSSPYPATKTCADQKSDQEQANELNLQFMSLLAGLEWPSGTPFPGQFTPGPSIRSLGASLAMDVRGIREIPDSDVAGIYDHFASELEALGWTEEAGDSGQGGALGNWFSSLSVEGSDDAEVLGVLSVVEQENGVYEVSVSTRVISGNDGFGFPGVRPPLNAPELGIRGIPPGGIAGYNYGSNPGF